jgi:hypothetical protein
MVYTFQNISLLSEVKKIVAQTGNVENELCKETVKSQSLEEQTGKVTGRIRPKIGLLTPYHHSPMFYGHHHIRFQIVIEQSITRSFFYFSSSENDESLCTRMTESVLMTLRTRTDCHKMFVPKGMFVVFVASSHYIFLHPYLHLFIHLSIALWRFIMNESV